MTRTAVYAGSFDPPTLGHLDVAERVSQLFDKVYLVVAENARKQYLFSDQERAELLEKSAKRILKGRKFEVHIHRGLISDFCKVHKVNVLVRGLRAVSDFEGELAMATMNRRLNPDLETLHIMTHQKYFFLSSSLIKEVAQHGGSLKDLVPPEVEQALRKKRSR